MEVFFAVYTHAHTQCTYNTHSAHTTHCTQNMLLYLFHAFLPVVLLSIGLIAARPQNALGGTLCLSSNSYLWRQELPLISFLGMLFFLNSSSQVSFQWIPLIWSIYYYSLRDPFLISYVWILFVHFIGHFPGNLGKGSPCQHAVWKCLYST